ncbi:hypothetical protein GCM10028778_13630 [Barrientosiimonas marina]|uniref:FixH family protein n=1 Tax=Lentibacillus kimchii TaxID=1542911 RepID=A0ABW2UW54_9BACI
MKKYIWAALIILTLALLSACSSEGSDSTADDEHEEPAALHVDFDPPETAEAGETVTLKATVTYGDELVKDAEEVQFEYWKQDHKDSSSMVQAANQGNGIYTADVTFEDNAVYEIYAHTSARELHTMPKEAIVVGDAEENSDTANGSDNH